MNTVDIVFCALPHLFLDRVPGAPAILKATATKVGCTSVGIDLSFNFFVNQCNRSLSEYEKLGAAFKPNERPTPAAETAAQSWVNESIKEIQKHGPKIVGLSVFSIFQHRAAVLLATELKKQLPDVIVIAGGYGLSFNGNGLIVDSVIKKIDLLKPFHQVLVEKNLVTRVFLGDALADLEAYLVDQFNLDYVIDDDTNGIIFSTPVPDYSDYRLGEYLWNDGIALPVTGSRSCVRKCTFCDIPGQFGKFSYRSGEEIANEMIELSQQYNAYTFEFTDSLVNGSLKSFKEWLTTVSNYNNSVSADRRLYWFGQYICRPQSSTPSDIYALMKQSGVKNLIIGVESGSDAVLEAMNKKMTVKDVRDELDQFLAHGIQAQLLMLSGFFNETYERYLETLSFIVSMQYYIAAGAVTGVSLGPPLYINEKMPLFNDAHLHNIIVDEYNNSKWRIKTDPDNTYGERAYRRVVAQLVIDELGMPTPGNSILNLHQMMTSLQQYKQELLNGKS